MARGEEQWGIRKVIFYTAVLPFGLFFILFYVVQFHYSIWSQFWFHIELLSMQFFSLLDTQIGVYIGSVVLVGLLLFFGIGTTYLISEWAYKRLRGVYRRLA